MAINYYIIIFGNFLYRLISKYFYRSLLGTMVNSNWTNTTVPKRLPDKVSQLYYSYGLFCASHPIVALVISTVIVVLCG